MTLLKACSFSNLHRALTDDKIIVMLLGFKIEPVKDQRPDVLCLPVGLRLGGGVYLLVGYITTCL